MGSPKAMKQKQRRLSFIEALPKDLIVEIIASVAASSLADLSNTKLVCKQFYEAAQDGYVFRKVSMETLAAIRWRRSSQADLFLIQCEACGNPDALYRQGMVKYFSESKMKEGLDLLKQASDSGHLEATYVLGIILFSCESSRREGMELLKKVENKKNSEIGKCHARSRKILGEIWINNTIPRRESACANAECRNGGMRGFPDPTEWSWANDDFRKEKRFCSESCKWGYQLNSFCNDLSGD